MRRFRLRPCILRPWYLLITAFVLIAHNNADAGLNKKPPANDTLHINLRIDAGYAHYKPDKLTLTSGTQLRRLRATARWQLADGWRVYLESGFRSGHAKTQGMWLQYRARPHWKIDAGIIPIPFGLDRQTPSSNGAFVERALTTALTEAYQTGISTSLGSRTSNFRFGVFTNNPIGSNREQTYGWSAAGTASSRLWASAKTQIHGLASLQYRQPGGNLRLRARPETNISGQRLVDTGTIESVDSVWRSGLGLIYTHGSKSLVAEYIQARLTLKSRDNAVFDGWYVQGRWLLTGETRRFSERRGAFTRITPNRRIGALELSVRMSQLDLVDGDITGGRETNYALGLNWYASRNIRVLVNYTLVNANPNRKQVVDKPEIFQLLLQMKF